MFPDLNARKSIDVGLGAIQNGVRINFQKIERERMVWRWSKRFGDARVSTRSTWIDRQVELVGPIEDGGPTRHMRVRSSTHIP